jgi:hypothetical protein
VKSESARGSTFWFTVLLEKQAGDASPPEACSAKETICCPEGA